MTNTHLFLFGGGPPFSEKLGKEFAKLSKGKVTVLFVEREGWEGYKSRYTSVLEDCGVDDFTFLPLSSKPSTSFIEELRSSTGIVIGGGDTVKYHTYIVDTEIGSCIQEAFQNGIPVAGFSAGALISPEHCVIPPIDNDEQKHLFLKGLSLLTNRVISVHYTYWNEEPNLKKAISKLRVPLGFGIDDEAGIYFKNGVLTDTEGAIFEVQDGDNL